uniref:Uncharacterized protein n=1 Tax=Ditylenchus dipsaci TaxID=166011 RepID=A0A915E418_9BILA
MNLLREISALVCMFPVTVNAFHNGLGESVGCIEHPLGPSSVLNSQRQSQNQKGSKAEFKVKNQNQK